MIRSRKAIAEMGNSFQLFCIILAASTCTVVKTDSQRGAQQLTEELLRDRRQASSSSSESKSLGSVVAHLVSGLSSLKAKQHNLKSELTSNNKSLGSVVAHLVSGLSSLKAKQHNLKSELTSTNKSDDCQGALLAQQAAQLSSLKDKLHALEISQLTAKSDLQSTKSDLQSTKSELQSTKLELQTAKGEFQTSQANIETKVGKLNKGKGSSFVRWGRKICPNNTTLVYTGVAGGKDRHQKGSGTNRLCLTWTPQFDNTAKPALYGTLYGAEYKDIPGHLNHDVPCSVCLAPQSTTIMVPATLTCTPGWTPQYTGHLVSSSSLDTHYATEYVCLDGSPENDSSGVKNNNGLLFYYVVTVCGSLPCPPYINDKVVTCVVCSK